MPLHALLHRLCHVAGEQKHFVDCAQIPGGAELAVGTIRWATRWLSKSGGASPGHADTRHGQVREQYHFFFIL